MSQTPALLLAGKPAGGALDFKGYYAALGIEGEHRLRASHAQIKQAYRRAAKRLHPDKHAHKSDSEQQEATKRFRELQTAYSVLQDPDKRRAYNAGATPQA